MPHTKHWRIVRCCRDAVSCGYYRYYGVEGPHKSCAFRLSCWLSNSSPRSHPSLQLLYQVQQAQHGPAHPRRSPATALHSTALRMPCRAKSPQSTRNSPLNKLTAACGAFPPREPQETFHAVAVNGLLFLKTHPCHISGSSALMAVGRSIGGVACGQRKSCDSRKIPSFGRLRCWGPSCSASAAATAAPGASTPGFLHMSFRAGLRGPGRTAQDAQARFLTHFKAPNPLVVTAPTWGRRFLSPQSNGAGEPNLGIWFESEILCCSSSSSSSSLRRV